MEFAGGRIVMVLEGGYNLNSLANSVLACVEALLEDKSVVGSSDAYPFEATWRVIRAVMCFLLFLVGLILCFNIYLYGVVFQFSQ